MNRADAIELSANIARVTGLAKARRRRVLSLDPLESAKAADLRYVDDSKPGLTRKALEPIIGGRGRVSEVLAGKRELSKDMIRRLHKELGVPLESLLG